MYLDRAFFAYSSTPTSVGATIEAAVANVSSRSRLSIASWKQLEICGHLIADQVLERIDSCPCFIADITRLNFNVVYEIGFAIGRGKSIYLVRNEALNVEDIFLSELGIFDTLGYETYRNSEDLTKLLLEDHSDLAPIEFSISRNARAPIYIVQPKYKTDFINRTVLRINKARLFFRQFDPNEQARLAAFDAIENVAQSYGVVIPLLSPEVQDARMHNMRAAFVAGLAEGFDRVRLILQEGESPVPIDYRDFVKHCYRLEQIDEIVADFVPGVTELFQAASEAKSAGRENLIQTIHLGSSTAENEVRDLPGYYLETDAYQRVTRGEARVVVGRKGSGKTAIFYRSRERFRRNKNHVVLDLKPEGYQFRKLRDSVLSLVQEGTQEHLVMAFWEYVLYLELCNKLLEMDKERQARDPNLHELYQKLSSRYAADEYVVEGDFSDRLNRLAVAIAERYAEKFGQAAQTILVEAEITQLLYRHDLSELKGLVKEYVKEKDEVWVLIDNIDKGWPSRGIEPLDVLIIRTLLEATRKIERDLGRDEVVAHTIVFLRNDVYELILEDTPDRGKESRVGVDWLDGDLLRELIRLRLVNSGLPSDKDFDDLWRMICAPLVNGEESSQYLIDRCLMRPRALIDLINHCRSVAVNLRHSKIEQDDIKKGLALYSDDLVSEVNLEIRDVMPEAENLLYHFIGGKKIISQTDLEILLLMEGRETESIADLLLLLYWHGALGLVWQDGHVEYIYDVNYNMRLFSAQIEKMRQVGVMFQVNPAFWPALGIE